MADEGLEKHKSTLTKLAGLFCIFILISFFFIKSKKPSEGLSFPLLPTGAFVGQISLPDEQANVEHTIFIEKINKLNALLIVIFKSGWKPQTIPVEMFNPGEQNPKILALKPINLVSTQGILTLYGKPSGQGFSGEWSSTNGSQGSWAVSPVAESTLNAKSELNSGTDLKRWLESKNANRELKSKREKLNTNQETIRNKYLKLAKSMEDENSFRESTKQHRDRLTQEIEQLKVQQEKVAQDLRDALGQLSLLQRISKRGQAVELARKITKRENKWYAVNWSSEEDVAGVEQYLAEKEQVDLAKLNSSVKKAEEIEALQNSIYEENARIQALTAMLEERKHPTEKQVPSLKIQEEEKPWWKKLDVF